MASEGSDTVKVAVKEKESKNQIDGKHILCEHAAARTLNKRLQDD